MAHPSLIRSGGSTIDLIRLTSLYSTTGFCAIPSSAYFGNPFTGWPDGPTTIPDDRAMLGRPPESLSIGP
jgi:hypothetical protein